MIARGVAADRSPLVPLIPFQLQSRAFQAAFHRTIRICTENPAPGPMPFHKVAKMFKDDVAASSRNLILVLLLPSKLPTDSFDFLERMPRDISCILWILIAVFLTGLVDV